MSPRKIRDGPRLPRQERTPGAFRCISVFCQNSVSREKRPQGRIGFFVKDIKLIFVTLGVLKYFPRTKKPPACSEPSLRARLRTGQPTSTRPLGRAWPRARRWRARASGAECRGWAGPGSISLYHYNPLSHVFFKHFLREKTKNTPRQQKKENFSKIPYTPPHHRGALIICLQ